MGGHVTLARVNESPRREVDPRWIYLAAALLLAALPFAAVDFIPGTDLPQHAAQIRLLQELWGFVPATRDLTQLVARPLGANTLCYWPALMFSAFASPELAIKLCAFTWIAAAIATWHLLAWRRGRPLSHALVASTLLFGLPFYWGLLNFLAGLAPFFVFCERALRPGSRTRSDVAIDAALVFVLYLAHVLWLGTAGVLAAVLAIRSVRTAGRDSIARLAPFAPVVVVSVPWLANLTERRAASGVQLGAQYLTPFSERLSPGWLAGTLFGGVRGAFEPIVVVCIVVYAIASVMRARRSRLQGYDRALIGLGFAGLGFVLLAPDQYLNTMLFNDRFFGCSAMFLLLGLPSARGRSSPLLAGMIATVFSLGTTAAWITFEATELSGLRPSLAAIGRPCRVLGLDYRKQSDVLRDRPFMQLFAYSQASYGGELSFSFASHQSSIVAYREPLRAEWTPGLEWNAELATDRDLAAFDCVVVDGTDEQHAAFAARFGSASEVAEGHVRSYCRARSHGAK